MKNNNFNISIGIPAYNEEKNIGALLNSVLSQELNGIKIKEIIVYSDASTDNTDLVVKRNKSDLIKLLRNKNRNGQAYAQNKIIENAKGDILVILNADIILKTKEVIYKLISPILFKKADLVSCKLLGESSDSKIGLILNFSILLKNLLYESFKSGINLYTCHGAIRAFSRDLYHSLRFKESSGEDAYSYLFCLQNGYKYSYVKKAVAHIISPTNFEDHLLQSSRFFHSQKLMKKLFRPDFVNQEYSIPWGLIIKTLKITFTQNPRMIIIYLLIFLFVKTKMLFKPYIKSQIWPISESSKFI